MTGTGGEDLAGALAGVLRPVLGPVQVSGLRQLPGGASRQTWAFDATGPDGRRDELVLRRDPPGRPGEAGAMGREAAAIAAAAAAGLAVPEVLVVHAEPAQLGTAALVMRRVDGESIARRILREDRYAAARGLLAGQLARFAAGLHALAAPPGFPRPDPLGVLAGALAAFEDHSGVFDLALDWLAARRPPSRDPVLVHGDLRLGNLIVGPDGLAAVLDWELTHAGDPAEDLGWLCVKAWRFGAAAPVAGVGSRRELLDSYRAAGGADISADELAWWEILGTLRWGVICLTQAAAHLSGAHRSVELAMIGRRACEQEWDLLLMLDPESAAAARAGALAPPADPADGDPAPFGRPTAAQLLEAVREYLLGSVLPATSSQLSFHARVAAGALATVGRELQATAPPPGATLAEQVVARLAVANPAYFDSPPP